MSFIECSGGQMESIRGDVVTKKEMQIRGIKLVTTDRGGWELRTHESLNTIAAHLIDKGFIDNSDYNDATVFMDLRRAYEATQGIKWGHINPDTNEAGISAGEAAERYDAIRHEMGVKRASKTIRIICHAMLKPFVKSIRAEEMDVYRLSFNELSKAMMQVRKKYA